MFTLVEGDWDDVMAVVKRCVDAATRAPRVSLVVKVDYRQGVDDMMHAEAASIERLRRRMKITEVTSVTLPRSAFPGRSSGGP